MKKIVCVLLCLVFLGSFAAADSVDLSGMSYDDLIALQKNLVTEIMSRPEWKKVTVPAGTWKVGEDIPAGTYGVSTDTILVTMSVYKNENKDFSDLECMNVLSPEQSIGKLALQDGWVVELTGEVFFTPPVSLGF